MDKLCKLAYEDEDLLYKYKENVSVPPLEMVDDIVSVSKCVPTCLALSETVHTFIELKKLELSGQKCSKIHIRKNSKTCPEHKVHENVMKNSSKEKYLGDFFTEKANSKDTIEDRNS